MSSNQTYIPGVCNIGPAEIAQRKQSIYIGLAGTLILALILGLTHASIVWRILFFIPATMAAAGFFQGYFHFCIKFGMQGMYNVMKPLGQTESVEKAEFRNADRKKAITILILSAMFGVLIMLVALLV